MREAVRQLVLFACVVLLLAASLAYIDYRWLEPRRVPPCNPSILEKGYICLRTVLTEWGNRVVWIDARSEDAFERGTMSNARVFPLRNDSRAQELLAAAMPALYQASLDDECIVIFCDRNCNSSKDIAKILEQYEIEAPIFILEGGWDEIKKETGFLP